MKRIWLEKQRQNKKMTMLDLANKLHISESYYFLIENGKRKANLDLDFARRLSVALGISLDQVIREEEKMKSEYLYQNC